MLTESMDSSSWGRVDDTNTVFVRDGDVERAVGQYPDGTPDEALAYFARKYDELAGQVMLLEQRVLRGTVGAEAHDSAARLSEQLQEPAVVGDIEKLRLRVRALLEKTAELSETRRAERAAAREEALASRTLIVERMETLAKSDLNSVQWKSVTSEVEELFAQWQAQQKSGPHLAKSDADELWRRFRKARQTIDAARRSFFAKLDATQKEVKQQKLTLIAEAEALASKGASGIGQYRELLDRWKKAGHTNRKTDDALWTQFKAAGDVLFAAKSAQDAEEERDLGDNLKQKIALLDQAESLLQERDHAKAREQLLALQRAWDKIGKVPRSSMREVENRFKKLEGHVRTLADEHWRANNPETQARASGLRDQLERSIAELEKTLRVARESNDEKAIRETEQALEQQRAWLSAVTASH